ncbi:MAG: alpha-L-rhamnosidase N-terminal domain-containing protein, partial [Tepidisphaeraceae bacterium]
MRILGVALVAVLLVGCAQGGTQLRRLRCENLDSPLGIDETSPRLSWQLQLSAQGTSQTAYQVLAATAPRLLAPGKADLWDSGRVDSDQSVYVPYAGKALASNQTCWWTVRVWDQQGEPSHFAEPAMFTVGLLAKDDWKGRWIGLEGDATGVSRQLDANWIWSIANAQSSAPVGTVWFRKSFEIPTGRVVKAASLQVAADNFAKVNLNGKVLQTASSFKAALRVDLKRGITSGRNVLAFEVENAGSTPNPAGLLGRVQIDFEAGDPLIFATDASFKTSGKGDHGWNTKDFDDSGWTAAVVLGKNGMAPWGEATETNEARRLPARMLRKEFTVEKPIRRAIANFSGEGLSEFYVNGRQVTDEVLSPGLTEYSKRVFYVTRDVTSLLRTGGNALGVWLGNGRFYAPRAKTPVDTTSAGFPKLIFQMNVEYADGTTAMVASDDSWKVTDQGPIVANNEYDGEEYDARREIPGWNLPGFDDRAWKPAQLVGGPEGNLVAQDIRPIRV